MDIEYDLPEGAPIPGAMYYKRLPNGVRDFLTVIALEIAPDGSTLRAVISGVRFGNERITSSDNRLVRMKYTLYSAPSPSAAFADLSSRANGEKVVTPADLELYDQIL